VTLTGGSPRSSARTSAAVARVLRAGGQVWPVHRMREPEDHRAPSVDAVVPRTPPVRQGPVGVAGSPRRIPMSHARPRECAFRPGIRGRVREEVELLGHWIVGVNGQASWRGSGHPQRTRWPSTLAQAPQIAVRLSVWLNAGAKAREMGPVQRGQTRVISLAILTIVRRPAFYAHRFSGVSPRIRQP
jgi:hypothetical protein